jgi:hypothetical protein
MSRRLEYVENEIKFTVDGIFTTNLLFLVNVGSHYRRFKYTQEEYVKNVLPITSEEYHTMILFDFYFLSLISGEDELIYLEEWGHHNSPIIDFMDNLWMISDLLKELK